MSVPLPSRLAFLFPFFFWLACDDADPAADNGSPDGGSASLSACEFKVFDYATSCGDRDTGTNTPNDCTGSATVANPEACGLSRATGATLRCNTLSNETSACSLCREMSISETMTGCLCAYDAARKQIDCRAGLL